MDEVDAFMATQVVDDDDDDKLYDDDNDDIKQGDGSGEEEDQKKHKQSKRARIKDDETNFVANKDASKWGADPLFWTHLRLLNIHVTKGLIPHGESWEQVNRERRRLGFNHALPKTSRVVAHCQVMGTLVRMHRSAIFTTFTIDDGTALLDCVEWNDEQYVDEHIRRQYVLGVGLRCFGKLDWPQHKFQSPFRKSIRRVLLSRPPVVVKDFNEELFHWKCAMELWEGLYAEPAPNHSGKQSTAKGKISPSNAKATFKYGGELEDAVMHVIKNTAKMPLITPKNEQFVRERYEAFFKICFEKVCVAKEEPVASFLALKSTSSVQADSLVNEAVRRLIFRGHVIDMDMKLGLCAVLTHEDFLAPAILRIIAKVVGKKDFIPFGELLGKIREDARLYRVSEDRIKLSLTRLVDESIVVEGSSGNFALYPMT